MARTDPPRSLRIGAEWTEGEDLAAQLGQILGRTVSMTEYVRQALAEKNIQTRQLIAATELPTGRIIDVGDLPPGDYRLAGTGQLIVVPDPTRTIPPDLAFTEEDYS